MPKVKVSRQGKKNNLLIQLTRMRNVSMPKKVEANEITRRKSQLMQRNPNMKLVKIKINKTKKRTQERAGKKEKIKEPAKNRS